MADQDLNFLEAFPSALSVSRSTVTWDWNSSGTLTEYAANSKVISYDPDTLTCRGVRVQSESTQYVINSRASGASAPSTLPTGWGQWNTSGLTHEVVGTGTENGLPYVDVRVYGTPSEHSGFAWWPMGADIATGAAVDEIWTGSVFVKVVSGSMSGLYGLRMVQTYYDDSDVQVGYNYDDFYNPPSTGNLRNCRKEFTASVNGTGASKVEFWFETAHDTDPIDVTFRIAVPQLEKKRKASTPMLTTSATFTRAADRPFMDLPLGYYNGTQNIIFCQFRNDNFISDGQTHRVFSLNDGDGTDIVAVEQLDSVLRTVHLYADGTVEVAGVDPALIERTLLTDSTGRLIFSPTAGAGTAPSDGSGTITSGGTAQDLFSGATPAVGFCLTNPGTESLWFSKSSTAAPNAAGSIELPAGATYITPDNYTPGHSVSIYGAVTGQPFTAERW